MKNWPCRYGGYNPMGNRNPPQAGCPKQNIHRLLQDLVDAGFSVVSSLPSFALA